MPVFDSNEFIKRLAAAGMPEGQAEVLAREQIQLLADHLATKDDLRILQTDLARTKEELTHRLLQELHAAENRILVKMLALLSLFFTLLKIT